MIGDDEIVRPQRDDEVLDLPVAKRPEDLVGDDDGAPIRPRDSPAASKLTNQVSPFGSVQVKPGENPADFARMIVHLPGAGGRPSIGPRTASSFETGRVPMRLVNQLESGTSSTVFTLPRADVLCRLTGRVNRLSIRSTKRSTSCDAAFDAS